MRTARELADLGLQALMSSGAEKGQCQASTNGKQEFFVEAGAISLLRTTHDMGIDLTALVGDRKGSVHVGSGNPEEIAQAARDAVAIASSGVPDDANDIAEFQPAAEFREGVAEPDMDLLFDRLSAFLAEAKERFPKVKLTMAGADHNNTFTSYRNSNGVQFDAERGLYGFGANFSAKDGEAVGSMNGTGFLSYGLSKPFMECGTVESLLRQSEEHLCPSPVEGKFVGDIVITPDCMGDFVGMLGATLSDGSLIRGTSMHRDKMDEEIASPLFSLHSRPVSGEIAAGYRWTGDGYASRDLTVVDRGVLKSFLLSLYGSRKTKKAPPTKSGACWVVDPGDKSFGQMIAGIERGLLLSRYSGSHPGDNGDFSGVAKNSYLIENGTIKHPLNETMISGNLSSLLKSIVAVSQERVEFGYSIYPWVQAAGVTISGK